MIDQCSHIAPPPISSSPQDRMEEVDMPEDWLGLPCNKALGAQMASMEGNLRCPICSELIKAAMTAKCGHAFCSACVRAWLGRSTETKFCPTCKVSRGARKW